MSHQQHGRSCGGNRGFSLVELSVVLFIIAIITGMAVTSGIGILASTRQTATQQKMKAIENALMQYRIAKDRIPCPADLTLAQGNANYGVEAAVPGTCTGGAPAANFKSGTAVEGAVPVVTLGLSGDFMYDGWGNRIRYAVDTAMSAAGAFSTTPLGASCGTITVNDASGNARSTKAMYALISHGANGHGAYTKNGATVNAGSVNAKELTNCHCNSAGAAAAYAPTYVQMNASQDSTNALNNFDDIVLYKERWQLRADWDKAGGSCMAIYVFDHYGNRVEKFDANGNYLSQFGVLGNTNGTFYFPFDVTLDASGNIWVVDNQNHRIQKFDSSGNYVSQFGTVGSGDGQFTYPSYMAFDSHGNIFVTDTANYRVEKFDSSGNFLLKFGSQGIGDGQFNQALGIAVDASDNVWVVDNQNSCCLSTNDRVEKFDSNGNYLSQFGGRGSADGQLFNAWGITIDHSGNIWVADTSNGRLQKFDSNGNFVSKFGTGGSGDGQMYYPVGIAFDVSGNIYEADAGNHRVQKFDSNGNYLSQWGTSGTGDGQFNDPYTIAITGR